MCKLPIWCKLMDPRQSHTYDSTIYHMVAIFHPWSNSTWDLRRVSHVCNTKSHGRMRSELPWQKNNYMAELKQQLSAFWSNCAKFLVYHHAILPAPSFTLLPLTFSWGPGIMQRGVGLVQWRPQMEKEENICGPSCLSLRQSRKKGLTWQQQWGRQ